MAEPPKKVVPSTYDYYKFQPAEVVECEKMVDESNPIVGFVESQIMDLKEFIRENHFEPHAPAFYDPNKKKLYVVKMPGVSDTVTSVWEMVLHEKGHHIDYPRDDWNRLVELSTIAVSLEKHGIKGILPDDSTSGATMTRTTTYDGLNIIDDALVNFTYSFALLVERNPKYFGWFPRMARSLYERPLLDFDISKNTLMSSDIEFHHRFMTALGWFYLGVDSYAPDIDGGVKYGVEPYRSLCEVTCKKCGEKFATFDFKCPKCEEWNNTLDFTPRIGMLTDIRSPLVTASKNPRVVEQYKILQDYFIWVAKIGWAKKQAADLRADVFYDKFYRRLAENYARLLATGCKAGSSHDIPRLAQAVRSGRIKSLPVKFRGKPMDVMSLFFTISCAKCGERLQSPVCPRCGSSEHTISENERGILSFTSLCMTQRSRRYATFVKSLGGLTPLDVLPSSNEPLWGVFDATQYKSLDGWEQKDLDARLMISLTKLTSRAFDEGWDTTRFETEFLLYCKGLDDNEKKRIPIMMQRYGNVLGMYGINFAPLGKKLWGESWGG